MGIVLWALGAFYKVLNIVILIRCFASFLVRPPFPRWYQIVIDISEPLLAPCRKLLWRFQQNMGIDFSPVLALILLQIIYRALYTILYRAAF